MSGGTVALTKLALHRVGYSWLDSGYHANMAASFLGSSEIYDAIYIYIYIAEHRAPGRPEFLADINGSELSGGGAGAGA